MKKPTKKQRPKSRSYTIILPDEMVEFAKSFTDIEKVAPAVRSVLRRMMRERDWK